MSHFFACSHSPSIVCPSPTPRRRCCRCPPTGIRKASPSALKRYDLSSGADQASYAIADDGYCNDLAQDKQGSLYVTDSRHPRVLRWRPGAQALAV